MSARTFLVALMSAAVVTAVGRPAMADDLKPAGWRGEPLSVMAAWEFIPSYMPPDSPFAPNMFSAIGDGDPSHELWDGFSTYELASNMTWWADGNSYGLIGLAGGGSMELAVQNWIDDEPEKRIQIQITFGGAGAAFVSGIQGTDNAVAYQGGFLAGRLLDDRHWVEKWRIKPNPDWETIEVLVPEGTWVSEIVVDTVSVPGPATLLPLGLGGLAVLRRKRR